MKSIDKPAIHLLEACEVLLRRYKWTIRNSRAFFILGLGAFFYFWLGLCPWVDGVFDNFKAVGI